MRASEFQLRSAGNADFASRQKLLFDKLSTAEEECNRNKTGTMEVDVDDGSCSVDDVDRSRLLKLGRRTMTSRFRGRESIFKRPEGPAPKAVNRTIPDFHRNPHRWTKYSLEDVATEDLSEESNTRAALSFLNELKARKMSGKMNSSGDSNDRRILFKNSKNSEESKILFKSKGRLGKIRSEEKNEEEEEEEEEDGRNIEEDKEERAVFRGSRVVMPEYVVGERKRGTDGRKRLDKKIGRGKNALGVEATRQLKLAHLEEVDD